MLRHCAICYIGEHVLQTGHALNVLFCILGMNDITGTLPTEIGSMHNLEQLEIGKRCVLSRLDIMAIVLQLWLYEL